MRKWLYAAIALALTTLPVSAQQTSALVKYQGGFRLVDGNQLNKMVDAVNGLTGHGTGGTVSPGYFSNQTSGLTGPTVQTGGVIQGVGANSAVARVEVDSYANLAIFSAVRRNGTKASPTPIASADIIGSYNFHGASTTALIYGPAARMAGLATETWSSTAGGTKLVFSTTPNTTQTLTTALTLDQDAAATFAGAVTASTTLGVTGITTLTGRLQANGKLSTGATPPTLTSCGTGSPAITGSDTAGIVTMGTGATGCIITFATAYTGTPYCVVSWIATPLASQSYVTANTAITLTQTSASANKIQYVCVGPSGG